MFLVFLRNPPLRVVFLTSLDSARLADLVGGGFLANDARGLRATAAGRQRLNAVLAALAT